MSNPVRELAREWLIRAERDLRVARYLLTMPDPPPESVGFHAQQCAEKALCFAPYVSGIGRRGGGHSGAYLRFYQGLPRPNALRWGVASTLRRPRKLSHSPTSARRGGH